MEVSRPVSVSRPVLAGLGLGLATTWSRSWPFLVSVLLTSGEAETKTGKNDLSPSKFDLFFLNRCELIGTTSLELLMGQNGTGAPFCPTFPYKQSQKNTHTANVKHITRAFCFSTYGLGLGLGHRRSRSRKPGLGSGRLGLGLGPPGLGLGLGLEGPGLGLHHWQLHILRIEKLGYNTVPSSSRYNIVFFKSATLSLLQQTTSSGINPRQR